MGQAPGGACNGVARAIAVTLVVVAVTIFGFLAVGPRLGLYQVRTVLSSSMSPAIDAGDVAVATPVPLREVAVGDVIVYRIPVEDRRVVTHRVVEILEAGQHPIVRTKGDAVRQPDSWVTRLEGDTAWRVRGRVPKLGRFVNVMQQPSAGMLVLGAPLLFALIGLLDIWNVRLRMPRARLGPIAALVAAVAGVSLIGANTANAGWLDLTSAAAAFSSNALVAPTNPATAAGTCSPLVGDRTVVSWTPTSSTWSDGYDIQRSTTSGGPYSVIATVAGQGSTSYTDGPLSFSTTYYYVVRATKANWRSAQTAQVQRATKSSACL